MTDMPEQEGEEDDDYHWSIMIKGEWREIHVWIEKRNRPGMKPSTDDEEDDGEDSSEDEVSGTQCYMPVLYCTYHASADEQCKTSARYTLNRNESTRTKRQPRSCPLILVSHCTMYTSRPSALTPSSAQRFIPNRLFERFDLQRARWSSLSLSKAPKRVQPSSSRRRVMWEELDGQHRSMHAGGSHHFMPCLRT